MRLTIYSHTCIQTGKKYVGQTRRTMGARWEQHVNDAMAGKGRHVSPVLSAAIRKYGSSSFIHEVLDVVTTQPGADVAERAWIGHFGCRVPGGYNVAAGGNTTTRGTVSEETRRKISDSMRTFRASHTPEQKAAMSAAMRASQLRRSPEDRSEAVRRGRATMTTEQIQYVSDQMKAAITAEQRSANGRVGARINVQKQPHEHFVALGRARMASMTTDERKALTQLAVAARKNKREASK